MRLWDMYSLMPLGELHVHDAAVEGLLVRRHVRLGGIEVVVACCAPGAGPSATTVD